MRKYTCGSVFVLLENGEVNYNNLYVLTMVDSNSGCLLINPANGSRWDDPTIKGPILTDDDLARWADDHYDEYKFEYVGQFSDVWGKGDVEELHKKWNPYKPQHGDIVTCKYGGPKRRVALFPPCDEKWELGKLVYYDGAGDIVGAQDSIVPYIPTGENIFNGGVL
jgi:hypothetical protein